MNILYFGVPAFFLFISGFAMLMLKLVIDEEKSRAASPVPPASHSSRLTGPNSRNSMSGS
jgi:hypothetical protein